MRIAALIAATAVALALNACNRNDAAAPETAGTEAAEAAGASAMTAEQAAEADAPSGSGSRPGAGSASGQVMDPAQ